MHSTHLVIDMGLKVRMCLLLLEGLSLLSSSRILVRCLPAFSMMMLMRVQPISKTRGYVHAAIAQACLILVASRGW